MDHITSADDLHFLQFRYNVYMKRPLNMQADARIMFELAAFMESLGERNLASEAEFLALQAVEAQCHNQNKYEPS